MKIIYKTKKAFTLVEILTVVFLATLIIIAAYTIYLISYKSYKKNTASAELTQNARIALERMSRDIRQATEILTDLPEDPEAGTPPQEIKFQDGHNMLAGGQIQYIRYYLKAPDPPDPEHPNIFDLYRKVTHYAFGDSTDPNWVLWSTLDANGLSPHEYPNSDQSDQIKAEKISTLQFWGTNVITINLEVSDGTTTYNFQTKSLGRNVQ